MAAAITDRAGRPPPPPTTMADVPQDSDVRGAAAALVRAGCQHVFVTRGAHGVLWARAARTATDGGSAASQAGAVEASGDVTFEEFDAIEIGAVVSTRGAGDCFVGGAVSRLLRRGATRDDNAIRAAIHTGLLAASLSVQSTEAVPGALAGLGQ